MGNIRGKGLINKITIFEGTSPIVGKAQTITTLGTTNLLIPRIFVAPWHTGRPCFPPAKQRHLLGMDLKPFQVIKYQPAKTRLHRQCSMVLPWTLTKTGQSSAKCFIDPWKFWILKSYPTRNHIEWKFDRNVISIDRRHSQIIWTNNLPQKPIGLPNHSLTSRNVYSFLPRGHGIIFCRHRLATAHNL